MANEVQENDKELMVTDFDVNGQSVKLNANTVKNFLVSGNGKITDQEALMFISLCKYQHLNPFLNEAYLVKFGNSPAQQIVSKEAFMKRAEVNSQYDGLKAGCIVQRNDDIKYTKGAFTLDTDKILGGWAEVYRKDRKEPIHIEISSKEFSKGQATWKQMPANMIRKTAIVNALREAFPTDLGAMYTEEDAGSQQNATRADETTHSEPKKTLDDLVGSNSNKPVKDVTPDPFPTSNAMSDEETKRAYETFKDGGIDDDAETGNESESDGQTDLFNGK